ncbi:carboxymuconolactone decarboxylase family protein [Faecalicatena contorta]|uniref:carboxymuconolactone decarboxylase family protein n=1 Tax=Clostridia TaxID=186801 RepID=UPI00051B4F58|nr:MULTISPECIES: carboxymuconolactone decarboxylase family protein [Clostridia]MBM6685906.1 carboxymuconolactone decarboxylase family protein [Faecalicatena contorta]MBM6711448.1 carboxymuconolactone decarboxylase family protein [Faecalicatena contorta]
MERTDRTEKNNEKWFKGAAFEGAMDPEFTDIARGFLCGDVLSRGCLTDRQRALVTLTALTTCQTLDNMAAYTEAALGAGATPEEIKETLYQCTPYIGMERVWAALKEVNKAFQAAGIKEPCRKQGTVTEETRFEKGLAVQQEIFGADNINKMRDAAPEELKHIQDYLSAYCFGDFYTRGTLDLKMRELITFCAICCLGGCEPQAKSHAGANISVGNTREMLIDAVTQCLPFIGFPRTLNAISCINEVTR